MRSHRTSRTRQGTESTIHKVLVLTATPVFLAWLVMSQFKGLVRLHCKATILHVALFLAWHRPEKIFWLIICGF